MWWFWVDGVLIRSRYRLYNWKFLEREMCFIVFYLELDEIWYEVFRGDVLGFGVALF